MRLCTDPNRPKATVVQLRRPGTSATWSQTRGGHQVQRGMCEQEID